MLSNQVSGLSGFCDFMQVDLYETHIRFTLKEAEGRNVPGFILARNDS